MGDKKSPTRPKRQAKQTADDGYWDCSVCTFRNTAEAFKCSICDVRKGTSTRKPRINSQLVAQQVAQQYPMPPPPKKERRERSERTDKERPEGEGERAIFEGPPEVEGHPEVERPEVEGELEVERPGVERQELPIPEQDPPEQEKSDTEQQLITDKPNKEKDVVPAVTKKPSSKKTRPKTDNHQSPPSEKHSIQSGKSATKTNKISHISRPKLKNIDRSTAQQLAITVGNVTVIITDFKEKSRSSSTSSSTITSSAGSEQQHQSSGSESMDKGSSRASTPKGELSVGHDESY
ncbi:RING1 and YY1-binding protein B [Spinachia spinachia]